MALVRFGVDPRPDQLVRRKGAAEDRIEFVMCRATLLTWPRAAGLKTMVANANAAHPQATFVPYAWHYLTHEAADGMSRHTTRTLPGNPHGFGHLRDTPEIEAAWTSVVSTLESAGVRALVLKTPPSFSPSSGNQQRLATFVQKMHAQGIAALWQPEGLWTNERAAAAADELKIPMITTCLGSTGRIILPSQIRWLRVDGELPPRHADALAYDLAEHLQEHGLPNNQPPVVLFGGDLAYKSLRSFTRACEAYGLLDSDEDDDVDDDENDDDIDGTDGIGGAADDLDDEADDDDKAALKSTTPSAVVPLKNRR